jgi:ribosomal protein L16 Arg81 hydroxylase
MIDRRCNLTGDEFRQQYVQTGTAVIITDKMDNWPAIHAWHADYLKAVCGTETVEVMGDRNSDPLFEQRCNDHRRRINFSEFTDFVFSGVQTNNTYLVANNQFLETPTGRRLAADIRHPPEYLNAADRAGRVFLWFGPRGTETPLHYDVLDVMLAQVRGSKRMRLFNREQSPMLYNNVGVYSAVDCERPDYNRFPLYRQAQALEIVLNPGEMIYLPQGHWHQVVALEPSISVSFTNILR